ncbi:hypothetical protein [Kingella sp. (in: b-proteobacteria)]|nr:hypothetical protein [Kingella sp. (in: b-proteobacteria)]MDO4656451.1 hypothetical protein [Kingella sp. (in: b-proteobacteria)]
MPDLLLPRIPKRGRKCWGSLKRQPAPPTACLQAVRWFKNLYSLSAYRF